MIAAGCLILSIAVLGLACAGIAFTIYDAVVGVREWFE